MTSLPQHIAYVNVSSFYKICWLITGLLVQPVCCGCAGTLKGGLTHEVKQVSSGMEVAQRTKPGKMDLWKDQVQGGEGDVGRERNELQNQRSGTHVP